MLRSVEKVTRHVRRHDGPSEKSSGIEVVFFPIGAGDAVLADEAAGAGGVYELIIADIDADVGVFFAFLDEEQKVALPGVPEADGTGAVPERLRAVGEVNSGGEIAVSHEAAAVEPGGHIALILVGLPDHGERRVRRLVAGGRGVAGHVLRRRRGAAVHADRQYDRPKPDSESAISLVMPVFPVHLILSS